jgi:cytochrome d ubiquinol oxidase subunit I
MSAYFILVANSWMQHPVGYKMVDGEAQLTDVWALLSNEFAVIAWVHTILAGLIFGTTVLLGVSCWHILRGRNVELFRRGAALALIVAVPATLIQLSVGNPLRGGGHERAGHEDRRLRGAVEHVPTVWFLPVPDRGLLRAGPGPELLDHGPAPAVVDGHRLVQRPGAGLNQLQAQEQKDFGQGNYMPRVRLMYWSMRVMAMLGVAMFLIAARCAWLYRKRRLEKARWFLWTAVIAIAFPFIAATFGWILTEMGRQPWIVQDLLKTSDAHSPSVSTAMVASSIGVFALLYIVLGVVDFVLMRRYARVDPPPLREESAAAVPALSY